LQLREKSEIPVKCASIVKQRVNGRGVDPLSLLILVKKVKSSTCYNAYYMRRTHDQKRFTILKMTADWHELMTPQRSMQPSVARLSEQLDPRFAASRHITAPINYNRPLLCSPQATTHFSS